MKKWLYVLIVLCLFIFTMDGVSATGGGLRKNSIKTCPNGVTYGLHSDGNGGTHWHVAVTNGDNYYADGEAIYSDPCPSSTVNQGTAGSTNGSNSNSSSNNYSNNNSSTNYSNSGYISNGSDTSKVVQKSNDTKIYSITINGDNISKIEEVIDYTSAKKKLDIVVKTNDSKASYKIEGPVDNISKDEENKVNIIVTAEDGTTKTYIVNVKRKIDKSNVKILSLKVNDTSVTFDADNKGEVSMYNSENEFNIDYSLSDTEAKLIVTKDGKEVKNGDSLKVGKNEYQLTIIDSDENENIYYLTVERWSFFESIIYTIIGFAFLGGIGYIIYYFIKKKKAK